MAKAFICILDSSMRIHAAVIDLEHLPSGTNSDSVNHFATQGAEIGKWLSADLDRAAAVADSIAAHALDSDAKSLISQIASFFENAPPSDSAKDLVLAVREGGTDIIRTSPEVAERTWRGLVSSSRTGA